MVLDVVDDAPRARHEPAHGGEGLGERPDDQVDLVLQPEVLGVPLPVSPSTPVACASSTTTRPVPAGELHDAGQVGDVAAHREDAVGDYHAPARLIRVPGEQPFEIFQVVVAVLAHRAEGEPRPVVEAGVVLAVEVEDVPAAG